MAPVIFPLLTGALQQSLSQSPWGEDIKQRKNLSHFIVFYHRELISLFSLCLPSSSLFFTLLSYSSHSSSFLFPSATVHLFLYLYFIKFDVLTMPFERFQLVKNTERAKREKGGRVETHCRAGERHSELERREMDVCLESKQQSVRGRCLKSWGGGKKAHLYIKIPELYMLKMCK